MLWHMTRALAFPARATAALMLALGVLGAGCSEDEPSAEEKFWKRYGEIYCSKVVSCCQAEGRAHDVGACEQATSVLGVLFGKGEFSQARADLCLSELQAWDCSEGDGPDSCDRVFQGKVGPGGACDTSMDCARPAEGGVTCYYTFAEGSENGAGVCKTTPKPAAGQPCGSSYSTATEYFTCEDDPSLYCDWQTEVCKTRLPIGSPCELDECAVAATCSFDDAGGKSCVASTPIGGDCSNVSCVEDAYCDQTSQKCVKLKGAGEPCSSFFECDGFCDSDTGKCEGSSSFGVSCVTRG
ncbi:MAG: hypothetical protein DYH12_02280 [Sorangiineae bacterium PRO1]|nr:hypothetical protein [Sorangiineae bacterium PRO1]